MVLPSHPYLLKETHISIIHMVVDTSVVVPQKRLISQMEDWFIIGKAGETIQHIQLQSGAKIQVTRDMDVQPRTSHLVVHPFTQPYLSCDLQADAGSSGTISNWRYNAPQPSAEQSRCKLLRSFLCICLLVILQLKEHCIFMSLMKILEIFEQSQLNTGKSILPLGGDQSAHFNDGSCTVVAAAQSSLTPIVLHMVDARWAALMLLENLARIMPEIQQGYHPPRPRAKAWSLSWCTTIVWPATLWQSIPPGTGYDYYNQQKQPQEQQYATGTAAPPDASSYDYSQSATHASQGYGDSTYSQ
ncbi:hypothetical protein VPH35_099488 [Triticum aestivum]|uniref:K Homology domain-containing protein n=1 Tax=Aegilops tauschii TaxID=37682 RepID=M8BR95_AEGTA